MEKNEQSPAISHYCDKVCEQIRWKKAKEFVCWEIEQHLSDQRDAYVTQGEDEDTATRQAILQMGDPVMVGEELDKTHKPKTQVFLLLFVGIIIFFGGLSTYDVKNALGQNNLTGHMFQYLFASMVLLACYHLDFTLLGKYPLQIYGFVLLFTIYAHATAQGDPSRQVFLIAGYHIPLNYLFFLYPLTFALFVYAMRNKGVIGFICSMLAYVPFAEMLNTIPSLPTFFSFSIIAFSIFVLAISRNWFGITKKTGILVCCVPTFFAALFLCYKTSQLSYVQNNDIFFTMVYFENPKEIQEIVREILAQTPFWGETSYDFASIPQSIDNTNFYVAFLLEFRLAYLVSNYGFAVLLLVVGIYTAITLVSVLFSLKQRSVLGTLVSFSIIGTFLSQCAFSMVDSMGYGLFSGIPVPFLAHGFTSLLINSALIGFMLSVFRTGSVCTDPFEDGNWSKTIILPQRKERLPSIKVSVTLPKKNG